MKLLISVHKTRNKNVNYLQKENETVAMKFLAIAITRRP